MKKILIVGSSGLVGSRFVELYSQKEKLLTPSSDVMDITSKESTQKYFEKYNPEIVINFAAYTNLNEAENQRNDKEGICWKVNVDGVENLIANIDKDTRFIQISTDMVFTGTADNPGPYSEDCVPETDPNKLGWYAFTKAEAERKIISNLKEKTTILRIIYPFRSKYDPKLDFLRKPLNLFDQRKLYPMFNDQQISVTFIDDVCMTLEKIIESNKYGIFHASSSDTSTPFELISYLLEKVRGVKDVVIPSSLSDFLKTVDNPVRYPKYGGLNVKKTEADLNIKFSSWKEMVDKFISQL